MNVNVIPCLSDNYSYCVVDPETKKVVIVDPAEFDAVDSFLSLRGCASIYLRYNGL